MHSFEPGEIRPTNDVVGATAPASLRQMRLEDLPQERLSMAVVEMEALHHTIYLRKKRIFPREGSLEFESDAQRSSLRAMLSEPIGRFYLHDYAKAKALPGMETRLGALCLVYKLALEFEMEGRVAPYPLQSVEARASTAAAAGGGNLEEDEDGRDPLRAYPLETDEDRYARLDEWVCQLASQFVCTGSLYDEVTSASVTERAKFLEAKRVVESLQVLTQLDSGSLLPEDRRKQVRLQVFNACQPLAHASFLALVGDGSVREYKLHSEYKRYKAKFSQCYNNVNHEDFDFMAVLGKGSFGRVLRVRKKTTQKQYAMKIMSKRKILSGAENAAQVTIERNVLVECCHPNVIKVNYAFHTTRALFLVLDLLEGGTLITAMNNCGGVLPVDVCAFFTAQIVLGLEHLHDHGILFRDLKPLNVLLDRKGNAVLTDMGLACKFRPSKPGVAYNEQVNASEGDDAFGGAGDDANSVFPAVRRNSIPILPKEKLKCVGTYGFRAPELMNTETDRTTGYGPPVDYFALGVTLCYLMSAKMPFRQRNQTLMEAREKPKDAERRLQKQPPRIPVELPESAQDVCRGLLHLDPLERYGDADLPKLKRHPFFQAIDWDKLAVRGMSSPYQAGVRKHGKDETPQFTSVHAAMAQFAHENVLEMFGGENEMKDEYTHVPRAEQKHFRTWDFIPDSALEVEWSLAEEQIRSVEKPFPRRHKLPQGKLDGEEGVEEAKKQLRGTSHKFLTQKQQPQPQDDETIEVVGG